MGKGECVVEIGERMVPLVLQVLGRWSSQETDNSRNQDKDREASAGESNIFAYK